MWKSVMAAAAALAASLAPMAAHAHADDGHGDSPRGIDCGNPPADAVARLPAPLNDWARLDCNHAGQMLAQGTDWVWRYPASFTTPVHIPAWTPDSTGAALGGRYFTGAEIAVLRGEAAHRLEDRLASEVVVYREMATGDGKPPAREVYTLHATNDMGQSFEVHFLYRSDHDIWGLICAPDCASDRTFLLSSRRN
jgi:hypothetical protein